MLISATYIVILIYRYCGCVRSQNTDGLCKPKHVGATIIILNDFNGSDLEDKLQTYNQINEVIRRHFGKQMNKEAKLRIHNITTKAELKFGSEAWVLKKERNSV